MRTTRFAASLIALASALPLACGLAGCGGGGGSALPARYTVTDLGLGVHPMSINVHGQVVGQAANHRAFRWDHGTLTDLGTLGGDASGAYAISDGGHIVGSSRVQPGNGTVAHAFRWRDGVRSDLGVLPGHVSSEAFDVSASGQIVGASIGASTARPAVWQDGTAAGLAALPPTNGYATAINSDGLVAGVQVVGGKQHAWLWRSGTVTDLGTLAGGDSSADSDINASGVVVGRSAGAGGQPRAFVWRNGAMTSLGVLPGTLTGESPFSSAASINRQGLVVGESGPYAWVTTDRGSVNTHAFVYRDGQMTDLNALLPSGSGWMLYEAVGINDIGQIVGRGVLNGRERGCVLTPP